jgi:hypothetical protein
MLALLYLHTHSCYDIDAAPVGSTFTIDPNACFAFSNASVFAGVNVTVTLAEHSPNTFFGLNNSATKVLPDFVFVLHRALPHSESMSYETFTKPIPVLCSPHVDQGDLARVILPEGVVTEDKLEVSFETEFVENCEVYRTHFQSHGNCVRVVRHVPELESSTSALEVAVIGLGLVLGIALIAACIIFLTPLVHRNAVHEGGADRLPNEPIDDVDEFEDPE